MSCFKNKNMQNLHCFFFNLACTVIHNADNTGHFTEGQPSFFICFALEAIMLRIRLAGDWLSAMADYQH